jgi:excisionase family DNA binding protein
MQAKAYSIAETCGLLSLSRPTVERLVYSGQLRSTKVGARRLIPAEAIDELLERGAAHVAGDHPTEQSVAAERAAQGLPATVTDPAALAAVDAALSRSPLKQAS